jgi:hypothetical protein
MKKILSTTAIAGSLCLLGTSAFAQFVGPYAGISISAAGVATEGSKTTNGTGSGQNTGSAPAGVITPLAALDLGYSFAAGKGTTIALGATYNPMKAEFDGKSPDTTAGATISRKFEVKDAYTVYIQPTFEINKDAAFFIKGVYSHAETSLSGTKVKSPGDLKGWGASTGLRVMLTKDAFIQAEAAYTQFDTVTAQIAEVTANGADTPAGEGARTAVTRTFTADKPELVEGRITLGFKF